ncbi:hypothetical protein [Haladaptatus pallidirubidus]|uniref:hypothetical protein n=1 Tax=Haladaptatus pallidirubidus TaxID=1008152 RepID=UPI0036F33AC4
MSPVTPSGALSHALQEFGDRRYTIVPRDKIRESVATVVMGEDIEYLIELCSSVIADVW